jgi:ribosomal protein S18 acetylase RimI-like enzyme
MTESYTVRRADPEDWAEWRRVRLRALKTDPLAFGSTWEREVAFPEERWRARLSSEEGAETTASFGAFRDDGELLGMLVGRREGRVVRLFAMWVEPRARRSGVGGRLLEEVLRWAALEHPSCAVELHVNPRQTAAIALYRSRGFTFTGERAPLGHGVLETTYLMRRSAPGFPE